MMNELRCPYCDAGPDRLSKTALTCDPPIKQATCGDCRKTFRCDEKPVVDYAILTNPRAATQRSAGDAPVATHEIDLVPKELLDIARNHLDPQDQIEVGVDMPLKEHDNVYRLWLWKNTPTHGASLRLSREVMLVARTGNPIRHVQFYIEQLVTAMAESLKNEIAATTWPDGRKAQVDTSGAPNRSEFTPKEVLDIVCDCLDPWDQIVPTVTVSDDQEVYGIRLRKSLLGETLTRSTSRSVRVLELDDETRAHIEGLVATMVEGMKRNAARDWAGRGTITEKPKSSRLTRCHHGFYRDDSSQRCVANALEMSLYCQEHQGPGGDQSDPQPEELTGVPQMVTRGGGDNLDMRAFSGDKKTQGFERCIRRIACGETCSSRAVVNDFYCKEHK